MTTAMTLEQFKTLGKRDWENGAVQDELYVAVKEREQFLKERDEARRAVRLVLMELPCQPVEDVAGYTDDAVRRWPWLAEILKEGQSNAGRDIRES